MRTAPLSAIAAWAVLSVAPAHGQAIRELTGAGCSDCIVVTKVATLGRVPSDTQLAGTDPRFARDSRGRIYVTDDLIPGRVFLFDGRGAFLRTVGRPGTAVGEFQAIRQLVVDAGDSLHVFDDALRRHTVLAPSGRVVRSRRYPGSNRGLILLPDGRVIVSRLIRTRERAGLPIHVSDDTGGIKHSFGNPVGFWRSDFPQTLARSICLSAEGELWAAHFTQYVLEQWSLDGKLRQSLGRRVPWFEPWISPDARIGEAPPQPRLTSIACESRLLWTKTLVADSQWREGLGVRRGESGEAATVVDPHKYYDTVIEVIDPLTRRVIGSRRLDDAFYEFFAPGYAWAVRPGSSATRQYEIWRVQFRPQNGGEGMTSTLKRQLSGALVTAALISGAITLVNAPDAYADQAHVVMSLVQEGGCKACEVCRADLSGHSCSSSGSGEPRICLNHGCFDVGCSIHNSCNQSSIDRRRGVNAIYVAVTRANGSRLRDYVRTLGKSAVVNEDRRALQLEGCAGDIVASIPLSEQQLTSLTDD